MPTAWECRLCEAKTCRRAIMSDHLEHCHGIEAGLDADLRIALHASKDYPDRYENTYGYYQDGPAHGESRLIAVHWRSAEREADDPLRFDG